MRKGSHHTEESKRKSGQAHLGQVPWNKGLHGEELLKHYKNGISSGMTGKTSTKKGKTWEEFYGVERANQIKDKLRKTNTGKRLPEEQKKKISDSLIGKPKTEIHRQRISQTRKESFISGVFPNGKPAIVRGWLQSYQQKSLYELVRRKYPSAIMEFRVKRSSGRPFFADIAVPELKIDIEYDGFYHNTEKAKEGDKLRDLELKSMGWKVFRVNKENLDSFLKSLGLSKTANKK